MTIDYNYFKDESRRTGVSVFTLIKRKLVYGKNSGRGMCKNCEFVSIPVFNGNEKMQCALIGIKDDETAEIKPTWSCRHGFKLREEQLKVITDFLNKYKE